MTTDTFGGAQPGVKGDARPPIGCIEVPNLAVVAKLSEARLMYNLKHPSTKLTRNEASLMAGASLIVSEILCFGFEDASVFEHPGGWGNSFTYEQGIDFTKPGMCFTDLDLRLSTVLGLAPSAALALFRNRDLLAGNPDMIGISCMAQRRAEAVGSTFEAALTDVCTIAARVLSFHRAHIEAAAAIIDNRTRVTRVTPGVDALLASARATPITELPPAPEYMRKLAGPLRSLGTLAREVSALAQGEPRQ